MKNNLGTIDSKLFQEIATLIEHAKKNVVALRERIQRDQSAERHQICPGISSS